MSVQALRRESPPSITSEQLRATLDQQRAAFTRDGPPSYRARRRTLESLLRMILDNQDRLVAAIDEDFGRSEHGGRSREESLRVEIMTNVFSLRHAIRSLRGWMRSSRRRTHWATWPSLARVEYVPLGVVGIIAPWNYPLTLSIGPLIAALAAGNRAMIKPSELTPKTSALLAELIHATFEKDQVYVAVGGVEVAQAFSALPFDHLLFTGSTGVGRHVMRAASDNLVPVTLELGGKSPTLIDAGLRFDRYAQSLVYGKLLNAGQTCIAPDYLLVHEGEVDGVVAQIRERVAAMFPRLADNSDYDAIINERHRERLLGYLEDAEHKGATVIALNPGDESSERFAETNKIAPTLVLDVDDSMTIMQDEIFGPLLPIVTYRDLDEAIAYINARPRPLAAYVYTESSSTAERVGARVVSGGLAINTTAVHFIQDDLPFGGVGPSGMGRYHGPEGFQTFSHHKAVYRQLRGNLMHLIAPPYEGAIKKKLIEFLIGS